MKARALTGKTVARVIQHRYTPEMGAHAGVFYAMEAIVFTDGSVLRFHVNETETNPEVEGIYPGRSVEGRTA